MKAASNILATASGSLNGTTFRSTRHGLVLSKKSAPRQRTLDKWQPFDNDGSIVNPPSMRAFRSFATRQWMNLEEAVRNAWYGSTPEIFKTTFQYFLHVQWNRTLNTEGAITDAPLVFNYPTYQLQEMQFAQTYTYSAGLIEPYERDTFLECMWASQPFQVKPRTKPALLFVTPRIVPNNTWAWLFDSEWEMLYDTAHVGNWVYLRIRNFHSQSYLGRNFFEGWAQITEDL